MKAHKTLRIVRYCVLSLSGPGSFDPGGEPGPGLGLMFMAPAGVRKNPSSRNDRNSLIGRLDADVAIFPNADSFSIRFDYLSLSRFLSRAVDDEMTQRAESKF